MRYKNNGKLKNNKSLISEPVKFFNSYYSIFYYGFFIIPLLAFCGSFHHLIVRINELEVKNEQLLTTIQVMEIRNNELLTKLNDLASQNVELQKVIENLINSNSELKLTAQDAVTSSSSSFVDGILGHPGFKIICGIVVLSMGVCFVIFATNKLSDGIVDGTSSFLSSGIKKALSKIGLANEVNEYVLIDDLSNKYLIKVASKMNNEPEVLVRIALPGENDTFIDIADYIGRLLNNATSDAARITELAAQVAKLKADLGIATGEASATTLVNADALIQTTNQLSTFI